MILSGDASGCFPEPPPQAATPADPQVATMDFETHRRLAERPSLLEDDADVLERVRIASRQWATSRDFETGFSCNGLQEFQAFNRVLRRWKDKEERRKNRPKRERPPRDDTIPPDQADTEPPSDYSSDSDDGSFEEPAAKRPRTDIPKGLPTEPSVSPWVIRIQ
ncbi:hypothetical protein NUW54_g14696 [Trametes sanguinea]|uniref:Uncharacterized protein n=1 Tax=Trametes sanguinea TaxID=158606 RepID=A0ACC1MBP0_9APHY|nr:hypothetical protein NUW54_g14696 [Trametes sanguinea]